VFFRLLATRDRLRRVLAFFGWGGRSRPPSADPYTWTPARIKPRPNSRSGAVAVAEPDDDRQGAMS
jgi:hypothetical protein